jgi:hypothetical protein
MDFIEESTVNCDECGKDLEKENAMTANMIKTEDLNAEFKLYYAPSAPGISNLYVLIAYQKKEGNISSEWYYFNYSLTGNKKTLYKGSFLYPIEIYGDNSELIFNSLQLNCKMEIVNKIIIPFINNNFFYYVATKNYYDFTQFNLTEIDKSMLVFTKKNYEKEVEKVRLNTKINKIKTYIDCIDNIKYEESVILE